MKDHTKFIARVLLICFIFSSVPTVTFAQNYVEPQFGNEKRIEEKDKQSEATIVKEVEELREENVKHFLKSDNTYEAVVYPSPVHYKQNGKWQDIDNTLEESKNNQGDEVLENKKNDVKVEIGKKSNAKKIINIKKDEYEFSWSLLKNKENEFNNNNKTQNNPKYKSTKKLSDDKSNTQLDIKVDTLIDKKSDAPLNDKTDIPIDKKSSTPGVDTVADESEKQSLDTKADTLEDYEEYDKGVEVQEIKGDTPKDNLVSIDNEATKEDNETLKNIKSRVKYEDIEPGVDLHYELDSKKIKESIILDKPVDNPKFKFKLEVNNLIPKLNKDRSISFFDKKNKEKLVYRLQSPFMYDSKKEISHDIDVKLDRKDKYYVLTIIPNKSWLDSKDRKYPVVVDPTVETSQDIHKIHDSYVVSAIPNKNYAGVEFLQIGQGRTTKTNRAYIHFDLPDIKSSNIITQAYLSLWLNQPNSTPTQIDVHKVNSAWDSTTVNWNNKPDHNSKIEDYAIVKGSAGGSPFQWDITDIAKQWTSTGQNNGLMLKNHNESTGYNQFISSDSESGLVKGRPIVHICYTDSSGLENYWTYHSQSVGRAGTGYVNDYNGNMVFSHNDLTMNGNKMPVSINHVFNSNEKDTSIGYGKGWRLNLNQRIMPKTISGVQYYVYIDEDGTKHYLKYNSKDAVYKDESGIDIKMTINSSSSLERYTISDKGDNKLIFVAGGYLYKIVDENGNTARLSYDGATLKSVTDGSGRVIKLDTNAGGYLLGITDPSGRKTSFAYDGINLTRITYPDGKYSTYTYDSNNNLTSANNYDGYKMKYFYYSTKPHRVKQFGEYGKNNTPGMSFQMKYGYNTTIFNDYKGKKNIYQFNNSGNTVSIRDDYGNALYYKYGEPGSEINKLKLDSKLQKPIMNHLSNHNAEFKRDWSLDNYTGSTGTGEYTTSQRYLGNQSLKVTKTNDTTRHFYSQSVSLQKGKTYTLSSYVKSVGISNAKNKGAVVFVNYQDKAGTWKTVSSEYIKGTNDWQRAEVSFELPADAASSNVYARVGIEEETGTAYFDCMQLEEGEVANRYNILENPNFAAGMNFWSKNPNTDSSDTIATASDSTYPTQLDANKKIFKIQGNASKDKTIYQKINLSGKAGDVFVVSGWAKADSVPLSGGRYFALDVGIEKNDGSYEWKVVDFNEDSTEWQYISDKIVTSSDYKSITFYCLYYKNENTAFFDGLQFYKEEFGQSYTYDDKGNVISTSDLADKNSEFKYDGNNNLVEAIDPKGNKFKYTYYSGSHNIKTATTAENLVYSFEYDSHGNPIKAAIGNNDNNLKIESKAGYTDDGNYIKHVEDSLGNRVNYEYNDKKGTLDKVTDANGNPISNSYDGMDRLTEVSAKESPSSNRDIKNSYEYEDDNIKSITHNGFNYNFAYDNLGNNTTVNVGNKNLTTNEYEARTSNWLGSTYGNGQTTSHVYDKEDRVIADKYDGVEKFRYKYDANCNLAVHEDLANSVNYRCFYDASERLSRITDSNGNVTNYNYNKENDFINFQEKVNGKGYTTSYHYDKDGKLDNVYYNNQFKHGPNMEYFPLSGTTVGSKGTKPYVEQNVKFEKDITFKNSFHTQSTTKAIYDLGLKKNSGTMGVWFVTDSIGTTRYILSSQADNSAILSAYLDAENKVNLAVRNKAGQWFTLATSTEAVEKHKWNYVAFTWSVTGDKLSAKLYLNDKTYTPSASSTADFKDFTGAKTAVGGHNLGAYQLNGRLEQFTYYQQALSSDDIKEIYQRGQGNLVNYSYDVLERMSNKRIETGKFKFNTKYTFQEGKESGTTTKLVSKISNNGKDIDYTYDKKGNIVTITEDGKTIKYHYNALNELIREDNPILNKTIVYSYDVGANITSKKEYAYTTGELGNPTKTYNYQYGDSNWKDKLTNFDGKAITYDGIGNPLTYDGWNFVWEHGRQLKSLSGNDYSISYKYNSSGIRTQKTVNGVVTNYRLDRGKVTYETNGKDEIYYTYTSGGKLVSMNLNGEEYYYIRNTQKDIIGLFDREGTEVVKYTYDSWGKLVSIDGKLKDTVGKKNPYRYRGYRYDSETGLYYLQSRYYNPELGRFINADALIGATGDLLGHNVFAYCKNNPANMSDPSGFRPLFTPFDECDFRGSHPNRPPFEHMRAASLEIMNNIAIGKAPHPTNAIAAYNLSNGKKKANSFTNNVKAASSNVVADKAVNYSANRLKYIRRGPGVGIEMQTFAANTIGRRVLRGVSGAVGIASFWDFANSAKDNFSNFGLWGGLGRTLIDAGGLLAGGLGGALVCGMLPAAAPIAVTIGVSAVIGFIAEVGARRAKHEIYGDSIW